MAMSDDNGVRSPGSGVRSPGSGVRSPGAGVRRRASGRRDQPPVGQGFTFAEDEIDRALGSLMDTEPSPALHANVMGRIVETRVAGVFARSGRAAGFRWRAALAAAVVLVVAASIWLASRHAPPPQNAMRRELPGGSQAAGAPANGARAETANRGARGEEAAPAPLTMTRTDVAHDRPSVAQPRRGRSSGPWQAASAHTTPVATMPEDMALPPLALPDPVLIAPLTIEAIAVEHLETPPLQIDPVEGKPSSERGR